ncbi:MAG: glutathione peroxidase [Planctomycetota bacterium]|nr:glutathione peroxidase [Planctomycetota bacterium]
MKRTLLLSILATMAILLTGHLNAADKDKVAKALQFKMKTLAGKEVKLEKYQGQVLLIVNVASECGLTGQYQQLQALHEKYAAQGLRVIGVPCNQFGSQEPGTAKEIQAFCKANYGVTFDLLAKVDVNGDKACGLYKHLTGIKSDPKGPGKIGWNFEKFVLNRKGQVVGRFDPQTKPDDPSVTKLIQAALADK